MAGNFETELVDGSHRASGRGGDGTLFYCESADPATATLWLPAAATLSGVESLPEGVTLGRCGRRNVRFQRRIPFGFDFHWVRELALSALRGATGFRLDGGAHTTVTATLDAPVEILVTKAGGKLLFRLNSSATRSSTVELKAAAQFDCEIGPPPASDPLLAALAGIHPLEWIRSVLAASGSTLWLAFASAAGVRTCLLDAIQIGWSSLSASAEAAVWRALGDRACLDELLDAARAVLSGKPFDAQPGSPAEEWLLAHSPCASAETARSLLSWLDVGPLAETAIQIRRCALAVLDVPLLAPWARFLFAGQSGIRNAHPDHSSLINRWSGLRDSIYATTAQALSRKLSAELTTGIESASTSTHLLDVYFPATPEGADALRSAASGSLDAVFTPGSLAQVQGGFLADFHARRRYLDLHLPFLGRLELSRSFDAISTASVVDEGLGRIAVYTLNARDRAYQSGRYCSTAILAAAVSERDGQARCDNLHLTFEHRFACPGGELTPSWTRLLSAYGVLPAVWPDDASELLLTLTTPSSQTLAWLRTPHPSSPQFIAAIARMSTALQLLMRRWLPALFFANPAHYEDLGAAWPLLVYAAGQPSHDPRTHHFTYDAMDPQSVSTAAFSATPALPALMHDARTQLSAAGLRRKLTHYTPYRFEGLIHQAIRSPQFAALLRADAFLVQDMVRLVETGREFRSIWLRQPDNVIRRLATEGAFFVRSFHRRIKRLYAGPEFLSLGSLILAEATTALSGQSARPQATLEAVDRSGFRLYWSN